MESPPLLLTPGQDKLLPWGVLRSVGSLKEGEVVHLYDNVTRIGRCPTADVLIPDHGMSRQHCVIRLDEVNATGEPVVRLRDISMHGVRVNLELVGKYSEVELHSGAVIELCKNRIAYSLEFLSTGLTPANNALRAQRHLVGVKRSITGVNVPYTRRTRQRTSVVLGKKSRKYESGNGDATGHGKAPRQSSTPASGATTALALVEPGLPPAAEIAILRAQLQASLEREEILTRLCASYRRKYKKSRSSRSVTAAFGNLSVN